MRLSVSSRNYAPSAQNFTRLLVKLLSLLGLASNWAEANNCQFTFGSLDRLRPCANVLVFLLASE